MTNGDTPAKGQKDGTDKDGSTVRNDSDRQPETAPEAEGKPGAGAAPKPGAGAAPKPGAGAAPGTDDQPQTETEPETDRKPGTDADADDQLNSSGRQRPSNCLKRSKYTTLYGPTTQDRVRLADTDLTVEIEADWAGGRKHSGNEMIWGGGKVIRESMGMSHFDSHGKGPNDPKDQEDNEKYIPVDTVITGALILDWWGVVKADVGIRDGKICDIGKAYNPETMNEITDFEQPIREKWDWPRSPVTATNFVVGPSTEVISGNGRILTAGGVDTHVHFICPDEVHEALASGVTTLIGGGTGPAEASASTTVTPGKWHLKRLFEALDEFPVNIGLLGKGSTMNHEALMEQLEAGVIGLKLHEDWGATPAVIDHALEFCDEHKIQLALHADSLNEAGFLESTRDAIKKRSIHVFHIEGAGGGHAPDMIEMTKDPNVLPASTNPTRPLTVNTVKEHIDMLMVAHHLNPDVPEDRAFADSRIRPSTMAAEDLLHDMGAISMMSSDAQAMGRIGEMIMRTWQTAHVMKSRYGTLLEDRTYAEIRTIEEDNTREDSPDEEKEKNEGVGDHSSKVVKLPNDNYRTRRYVAKYTINPAITHGIDKYIGDVVPGKMADLVLWEPKFFGVKPHRVIKGGQIAYAQTGDPNGSITTPQPYLPRPAWGSAGRAPKSNSVNFAAPEMAAGLNTHNVSTVHHSGSRRTEGNTDVRTEKLGLHKEFVEITDTRGIKKKDMRLNDKTAEGLTPEEFEERGFTKDGLTTDGLPARHIAGQKFELEVDHNTFEVTIGGAKTGDSRTEIDGVTVPRSYVSEVPMAQRYFLF